ncbi:hypothetical protein ACRRTK_022481 [Alexandromys fortis]
MEIVERPEGGRRKLAGPRSHRKTWRNNSGPGEDEDPGLQTAVSCHVDAGN